MKHHRKIAAILGGLAYLGGIVLGLMLCGWTFWGELEAALLVPQTASLSFKTLKCPMMIVSTESGIVSATFDNPTPAVIQPSVRLEISHGKTTRTEGLVLTLAPGDVKELQWKVSSEDLVFGRLILVSLYENSYGDYPSHQTSCGILVSRLPSPSGRQIFIASLITCLLSISAGLILWRYGNSPLRGINQSVAQASTVLTVVLLAGLVSTLPRLWGLTGFLLFVSLLIIVVIITEFVLFPSSASRAED